MGERQEIFAGTEPVRARHEIDHARLSDWMRANVEGFHDCASRTLHGHGHTVSPPHTLVPVSMPPLTCGLVLPPLLKLTTLPL